MAETKEANAGEAKSGRTSKEGSRGAALGAGSGEPSGGSPGVPGLPGLAADEAHARELLLDIRLVRGDLFLVLGIRGWRG